MTFDEFLKVYSEEWFADFLKEPHHITYDEEYGYTYIYLIDGVDVVDRTEVVFGLMVDIDADGRVAGIEVPPSA